uniref:Putative RNA-directed DNA polymerase n=1 Tax=Sipha flava TaxID=143950 RepID=A0A2S2PY89_9HEMI
MCLKYKTLIYKAKIRPFWSYRIQIWGSAKPSIIRPLQAFQSICLRMLTGASWFVTNKSFHKDLQNLTVTELKYIIKDSTQNYRTIPNSSTKIFLLSPFLVMFSEV